MAESVPSARQVQLLESAYRYVLDHGLTDLSLRPLATAIGTSPRVLLFLFGSKDGLVRALLARARADELAVMQHLHHAGGDRPIGLAQAIHEIWAWLSDPTHRPLLRLWAEAYVRSLHDPNRAMARFARTTVDDWLQILAACQSDAVRDTDRGISGRTLALAVLRGALLDLIATGEEQRITAAVHDQVDLLRHAGPTIRQP